MSYNTSTFQKKKKRLFYIKLTFFVILLFALLYGLIYAVRHPNFNIQTIEVSGNTFTKTSNIESRVQEIMGEKLFFFLPKTSILLLPRFEIKETLKSENTSIYQIQLNVDGLNHLIIKIEEHEPDLLVCKTGSSDCYFVNKESEIFLKEPLLHDFDDLQKIYVEEDDFTIGKKVFTEEFIISFVKFVEDLKMLNIKVERTTEDEDGVFYLETENGFDVVINVFDNLSSAADNLKTVFEKDAIDAQAQEQIDYIDLRFGNKVFYRLK